MQKNKPEIKSSFSEKNTQNIQVRKNQKLQTQGSQKAKIKKLQVPKTASRER